MMLMNKSLFSKLALDSDYQSSYNQVDERRLYCVSQTTRIQEIAEYGVAGQHTLPEDQGTGLIWRLYSVSRFEERDGGVYVEVEAMALSRDIPAALRLVAEPIVRRVSRDSLLTALSQTGKAVRSAAADNHAGPQAKGARDPLRMQEDCFHNRNESIKMERRRRSMSVFGWGYG